MQKDNNGNMEGKRTYRAGDAPENGTGNQGTPQPGSLAPGKGLFGEPEGSLYGGAKPPAQGQPNLFDKPEGPGEAGRSAAGPAAPPPEEDFFRRPEGSAGDTKIFEEPLRTAPPAEGGTTWKSEKSARPAPAKPGNAKPGNGKRRSANGKKGGGKTPRTPAQQKVFKRNVLLGSLVGLTAVALALALLLPFILRPASDLVGSGSISYMAIEPSGYDPNEYDKELEQYQGVVLGKTADAGAEYTEQTLFLGDSNTARMQHYRDVTDVTAANSIGVEEMGIAAVTTNKCVRFRNDSSTYTMVEAVAKLKPLRVVIMFGTNNGASGTSSQAIAKATETFIDTYRTAMKQLMGAYSHAEYIIASVPPVTQGHAAYGLSMTLIDAYNVSLAKLADELGIHFLNWTEALKDSKTGFSNSRYMIGDGYHLSRDGLEAMFTYFRTHALKPGEDNRPDKDDSRPELSGAVQPARSRPSQAPAGSDTGSSSSSATDMVTVIYAAGAGGSIAMADGGAVSRKVQPGGSCPGATAILASTDYEFTGWVVSPAGAATLPTAGSQNLAAFTLNSNVQAGTTVTITATFRLIVPSSSSSAPASLPEEKTVPPVVGLTEADAIAAMTVAGLNAVTSGSAYHDTIPVGSVVSQSHSPGSTLPAGSTVTIVISLGPAPATSEVSVSAGG